MMWSCGGKEGPQGPAGQDLARPQSIFYEELPKEGEVKYVENPVPPTANKA
jgi:hypothetical protein